MKYFDKLPRKLHVCKSKWVVPADSAHLGGLNIMGPTGLVLSGIPMQGYLAEQAPTGGPLARATWQNKLPQEDPLPGLPG
jgi:hypothetical protein